MKSVQGPSGLEVREHLSPPPLPGWPRYGSTVLKEVTDLSLERNFFFRYFRKWKKDFRNMLREELSSLLVQFAWSWIFVAFLKSRAPVPGLVDCSAGSDNSGQRFVPPWPTSLADRIDVTAVSINSSLDETTSLSNGHFPTFTAAAIQGQCFQCRSSFTGRRKLAIFSVEDHSSDVMLRQRHADAVEGVLVAGQENYRRENLENLYNYYSCCCRQYYKSTRLTDEESLTKKKEYFATFPTSFEETIKCSLA